MAQREVSWEELVRAGTVIFGPGFVQAVHGPGWRANLRAAWRQRVLETHPDRAAVLGQSEAVLQQRFRAVSEAFALLESFALSSKAPPSPRATSVAASPPRSTRGSPPPRGASPRPPSPPGPRHRAGRLAHRLQSRRWPR